MKAFVSSLGIGALLLFVAGGCGSDEDDKKATGGSGGGTGATGGGGGSGGSTGGSGGSTGGSGGSTGGAGGGTAGAGGGSAGAAGGGAGLSCAAFCALVATACTDANEQYADEPECMTECGGWEEGAVGATSGDTLGCRMYHAGVASGSAALATEHCPHTAPDGGGNGGPCTDP